MITEVAAQVKLPMRMRSKTPSAGRSISQPAEKLGPPRANQSPALPASLTATGQSSAQHESPAPAACLTCVPGHSLAQHVLPTKPISHTGTAAATHSRQSSAQHGPSTQSKSHVPKAAGFAAWSPMQQTPEPVANPGTAVTAISHIPKPPVNKTAAAAVSQVLKPGLMSGTAQLGITRIPKPDAKGDSAALGHLSSVVMAASQIPKPAASQIPKPASRGGTTAQTTTASASTAASQILMPAARRDTAATAVAQNGRPIVGSNFEQSAAHDSQRAMRSEIRSVHTAADNNSKPLVGTRSGQTAAAHMDKPAVGSLSLPGPDKPPPKAASMAAIAAAAKAAAASRQPFRVKSCKTRAGHTGNRSQAVGSTVPGTAQRLKEVKHGELDCCQLKHACSSRICVYVCIWTIICVCVWIRPYICACAWTLSYMG